MFRRVIVILVLLGVAGAVVGWRMRHGNGQAAEFQTAQVTRGDLVVTISATGTIEPEDAIDVGAQVGGKILEFGKGTDGQPVDYGSAVEEGLLLARIDDALYTAQVEQAQARVQQAEGKVLQAKAEVQTAEAQVQSAEAQVKSAEAQVQSAEARVRGAEAGVQQAEGGVVKAEADLRQLQAKLDQAKRDWDRAQKLGPSEALAQSAYDSAKANHDAAVANVAVGEAAVRMAKDGLAQAVSTVAENKALGASQVLEITGVARGHAAGGVAPEPPGFTALGPPQRQGTFGRSRLPGAAVAPKR